MALTKGFQYERVATDADQEAWNEDGLPGDNEALTGGEEAVDVGATLPPGGRPGTLAPVTRCCGVEKRRWPQHTSKAGTFLGVALLVLCLPMLVIGVAPLISEYYTGCSAGGAALWGSAMYIVIGVTTLVACKYKTTCWLLTSMALAGGGACVGGAIQCALIGYNIGTRISDCKYYLILHERCANIASGSLTVGRPWNWDEDTMGVFTVNPCQEHPEKLARAQMLVYVLMAMLGVAVLQAVCALALTVLSCRTTRCYTCEHIFGVDKYKPLRPRHQSPYEPQPELVCKDGHPYAPPPEIDQRKMEQHA